MKNKKFLVLLATIYLLLGSHIFSEEIEYFYNLWDEKEIKKYISKYEQSLQTNYSTETLKILGVLYHNLGASGVKGVGEKSMNYLKEYIAKVPNDDEALAYLGSAITIFGRDSSTPVNKVRYVLEGTKIIDKAVKDSPNNIVIRLVRINNTLALPNFFKREHLAEKDVDFLINLVEKKINMYPKNLVANIYYLKGEALKNKDKISSARYYWKKAAELAPDSVYGKKSIERTEIYRE